MGLAKDARQLRRVDERHRAEGVQHLVAEKGHISSVAELRARSYTTGLGDSGEQEAVGAGC